MKKLLWLPALLLVACTTTPTDNDTDTPPDSTNVEAFTVPPGEEGYWTAEINFEEKFIETVGETMPLDTAIEPMPYESLEGMEGSTYSGKLYLTQNDQQLSGVLEVGEDVLAANGKVISHENGERVLSINYEGKLRNETVYGNFDGFIANNTVNGHLLKVPYNAGSIIYGSIGISGILMQVGPGGPQKQEPDPDPCGEKLWEAIYTLRSPVTGLIIRMKIERWEHCIKASFVDAEGDSLPETEDFTLSEDLVQELDDDKKVMVYDAPLTGKKIGEKPDGDDEGDDPDPHVVHGEIKYIGVSGCTNVKYFQFFQEFLQIKDPFGRRAGRTQRIQRLGPDGTNPHDGNSLPPGVTTEGTPLIDIPSYPNTELPFTEESLAGVPDDYTIHHYHQYATYVCCDGELLGYVVWGYEVVYTIRGHAVASVNTVKMDVSWHDPTNPDDQTGMEDQVDCSEGE